MIKAIFFDLDGTLLPMDENKFINMYFKLLSSRALVRGYKEDEIIQAIWGGTKKMYLNDGKISNEDVFWNNFYNIYKTNIQEEKEFFEAFYKEEFHKTKACCEDNKLAKEIVSYCKENFPLVVLSTNPIFPSIATEIRMSFVDLKKEDFAYVTTYENSSFCKPNPKYFLMLLEKFNLKPEEVILFGNNELEDGYCATSVGIKTYMVGDYIIKDEKHNINLPHLKMEEVIPLLKTLK